MVLVRLRGSLNKSRVRSEGWEVRVRVSRAKPDRKVTAERRRRSRPETTKQGRTVKVGEDSRSFSTLESGPSRTKGSDKHDQITSGRTFSVLVHRTRRPKLVFNSTLQLVFFPHVPYWKCKVRDDRYFQTVGVIVCNLYGRRPSATSLPVVHPS